MNSFYLNFFILSKKKLLRNIRSCSEYLTLFTVYRMFTLRNLVSIIMKASAYLMYKVLTRSRDDSGSWPRDIFCKRYIVSLCPRLRYLQVDHWYMLPSGRSLIYIKSNNRDKIEFWGATALAWNQFVDVPLKETFWCSHVEKM